MRSLSLVVLLLTATAAPAAAVAPGDSLPPVRAVRLASPVRLDGALDDAAWQGAPTFTRLTQSDPYEGQAPTESTWVWVAHDDDALYVAARCWDSRPDSIIANLCRRDLWMPSDRVVVYLDPFRDLRSGYFFSVSAAGVLWDGALYNDMGSDDLWDGVWQARVRRDDGGGAAAQGGAGWSCELRVPFSQLRFRPGAEQVWGFNFRRRIERHTELDQLAWTPKRGTGFVSRFPRLVGLEVAQRSRAVELLPYTTGKAEFLAPRPGDPFNDGSRYAPGVGADLRMAVGNNLTLNATANPDFGQVEVDPAVVSLSDVESYFQEKRPFFTENERIFRFGNEGANRYWGFNWPEPRFFYSRRIGRAPQGASAAAEFCDVPVATRILGAAKLTGKLGPGLNFGTMHALTARERADYAVGGEQWRGDVEPQTYYGVVRGLREMKGGFNGVGLMTTLVQRRFHDDGRPLRDLLNEQSLMTGLDGWHFLDRDKLWVLSGWAGMSRVAGTPERLVALQRDPRHYLQRPDASRLGVDSSATSLTGLGARVWLNKQRGRLISNSAIGFMDPRFDVNDIGYQTRADVITGHTGLQYHATTPNRLSREAWIGLVGFQQRNFDGDVTGAGLWQGNTVTFANDYTLDTELMYVPRTTNFRRTRGGPRMEERPGTWMSASFSTAIRDRFVYTLYADRNSTPGAGTEYATLTPAVEWKPASNLSLSAGPSLQRVVEDAQYVRRVAAPGEVPADFGGQRYVFARLDQTTVSAEIRLNVSFSRNLTLQTYVQPLISAGRYSGFKELARANSYEFVHYGAAYDPATGLVTPVGGTPFALADPSFNVKSLRGNAVLRWEYRPGSVLYFVWTQQRSDWEDVGDLRLGRSARRLVDAQGDDIFLVKATYHLSL